MNIHESAEDYLEKILMLQEQKGSVRSIDIAVAMGFSKPSVSVAMKNLRENGYISVDGDGYIHLEEPGMLIAQRIYDRHRKLTQFFVALGVDPEEVMAFGDNYNDLPMLELAGHPYLMESAALPLRRRGFALCRRVEDVLKQL